MPSSEYVHFGAPDWAAHLQCPPDPSGVVLLVNDASGPAARSDRAIGGVIHGHGLATLHLDVAAVAPRGDEVHASARATARVVQALDWVSGRHDLRGVPCGVYGSSVGAEAALAGAALRPGRVRAAVTRDACLTAQALAGLAQVFAPTLLIVGASALDRVEANRRVLRQLRCVKRLEVVPQAAGDADDTGALIGMAELACWWYLTHLPLHAPH